VNQRISQTCRSSIRFVVLVPDFNLTVFLHCFITSDSPESTNADQKANITRSQACRERLKATGGPPASAVANALMAVVIEAELSDDTSILFDLIKQRAANIAASKPKYEHEAFFNVMSRFTGLRTQTAQLMIMAKSPVTRSRHV
jgi:hypothetical protein